MAWSPVTPGDAPTWVPTSPSVDPVWSPATPGDTPTWVPTSPSVDPVWRYIDAFVDALELEGSVAQVALESGFRLLLEQTESNANWAPVVT